MRLSGRIEECFPSCLNKRHFYRISLPESTAVGDRTAGVQQCLGELSFAGMGEPDEAHVASVSGSIGH